MDRKSGVIVIGNDTNSSILVVKQPEQNITDSLVFLNNLDEIKLNRGEIKSIWLPYGNLKSLPAKERAYFYIFNIDSLDKYRALKKIDGIMNLCLIKKFSIQLNSVSEKLDTVYIK